MIIVTTEYVSGKETEMLGLVKGSTIQTVNAFKDIGSAFKTLVGGELVKYNESGVPVAICMDDSEKLKTYYEYTGIKVDHVYAAFNYGKHMELARKYLDYLMN